MDEVENLAVYAWSAKKETSKNVGVPTDDLMGSDDFPGMRATATTDQEIKHGVRTYKSSSIGVALALQVRTSVGVLPIPLVIKVFRFKRLVFVACDGAIGEVFVFVLR